MPLIPFLHADATHDPDDRTYTGPRTTGADLAAEAKHHGFAGVQNGDPAAVRAAGLLSAGGARVDDPDDAERVAREHADAGHQMTTLHVGTGLETDDEVDRLLGAVCEAVAKTGYPLHVETHRATVTQDIRRTLDAVARHPALTINGDYSHYYTGLEMNYGDLDAKVAAMTPIFERVRFMHGRVGNSSNMQVNIADGSGADLPSDGEGTEVAKAGRSMQHVRDFKAIWTANFRAIGPDVDVPFAPELLSPRINYARPVKVDGGGGWQEETDRWQQTLAVLRLAADAYAAAHGTRPTVPT